MLVSAFTKKPRLFEKEEQVSANRQFPILDWIFDYQKDGLRCDLIAGLIATATHQAAAGISNSGANEMVLTGWQLPADWHRLQSKPISVVLISCH
jgi:hypothetical protein